MQGITLPPLIITPKPTPLPPTTRPNSYIARPVQIASRTLNIRTPEDFDKIRYFATAEGDLLLTLFATELQIDLQKRHSNYHANLDSRLQAEVVHLTSQNQTDGHTQAEKQLNAIHRLITEKRNELLAATAKAKLFPLHAPLTRKTLIRNGAAFSRQIRAAVHARKKPSVVYKSFFDAVTAGHERKLLTQSLSQLEKRAVALSADIATATEAKRIEAEKAKAEAARIAAEKAKAEAVRAEAIRKANSYHASGQLACRADQSARLYRRDPRTGRSAHRQLPQRARRQLR